MPGRFAGNWPLSVPKDSSKGRSKLGCAAGAGDGRCPETFPSISRRSRLGRKSTHNAGPSELAHSLLEGYPAPSRLRPGAEPGISRRVSSRARLLDASGINMGDLRLVSSSGACIPLSRCTLPRTPVVATRLCPSAPAPVPLLLLGNVPHQVPERMPLLVPPLTPLIADEAGEVRVWPATRHVSGPARPAQEACFGHTVRGPPDTRVPDAVNGVGGGINEVGTTLLSERDKQ